MEPVEFEKLRKLLALKRHEVPPPGYFDGFSTKVIARIRAGEAERPEALWKRWIAVLSTSPAMTGVFALAMLAFVITGVNLSRKPDASSQGTPVHVATPVPATALVKEPSSQTSNSSGALLVNADADSASNSAPAFLAHPGSVIVTPAGSLHNAETQQVNFPK